MSDGEDTERVRLEHRAHLVERRDTWNVRRRGLRERSARLARARALDGEDPNGAGSPRRSIVTEVENSLRRLGVEHLDLYQVHHPDPRTDVEETLSALTDLVRGDKVRAVGASNFPASEIVEAQWVAERRGLERFQKGLPDRTRARDGVCSCLYSNGACRIITSSLGYRRTVRRLTRVPMDLRFVPHTVPVGPPGGEATGSSPES